MMCARPWCYSTMPRKKERLRSLPFDELLAALGRRERWTDESRRRFEGRFFGCEARCPALNSTALLIQSVWLLRARASRNRFGRGLPVHHAFTEFQSASAPVSWYSRHRIQARKQSVRGIPRAHFSPFGVERYRLGLDNGS